MSLIVNNFKVFSRSSCAIQIRQTREQNRDTDRERGGGQHTASQRDRHADAIPTSNKEKREREREREVNETYIQTHIYVLRERDTHIERERENV